MVQFASYVKCISIFPLINAVNGSPVLLSEMYQETNLYFDIEDIKGLVC